MTQRSFLREQAERCRRLAKASSDDEIAAALRKMADEYERLAVDADDPPRPET